MFTHVQFNQLKLKWFFLIIWLSKTRLERTGSETENVQHIDVWSRFNSNRLYLTRILKSRLDSGEARGVSEIAHKCSRGLTTCWPMVLTVTFKRWSFAWDGSDTLHKWRNCLATCYDSTGVSRGRPNCLRMSGQETQTDLQIKSNNIENARAHHCNVCLL